MIDEVRRLLEYVVSHYAVRDEIRTIDRDAPALPDGQILETGKQQAAKREEHRANTLAESFNTGLLMAWRRFCKGGAEISLDDRDPRQNQIADALIQFLVRFDLAKSRTEETQPRQYTYYIAIDWPKLFAEARDSRIDLESALEAGHQWAGIVSTTEEAPVKLSRSRRRAASTPVLRMPDPAQEAQLAEAMGITFHVPRNLRLALTHRSVLQDWSNAGGADAIMQSNERLEFLGDAILGQVVAEHLYHKDPQANEGSLTRHRVAIVRAETLVRWAREIGLTEHLYLGMGEKVTEGARDRILAGAFEALIGAIWIDQGREATERFVQRFLRRDIQAILSGEDEANPKGTLQEIAQEQAQPTPEYVTIGSEGPDHARQFTVAVEIDGERLGTGSGRSKREAQQNAAREALLALREQESLSPDDDAIIPPDSDHS